MSIKEHIGLSKIKFGEKGKQSYQFAKDEYTQHGEQHKDILAFKQFLGDNVDNDLYALNTSSEGYLGNRTSEPERPSTRRLSMSEGNRFCEKTIQALKVWQLMHRSQMTHYGQNHLSWQQVDEQDSKSLNREQVANLTRGQGNVSGLTQDFAGEFGKFGPATIAVMLGYSPHNTVMNPDYSVGVLSTEGVRRQSTRRVIEGVYGSLSDSGRVSTTFFSTLSSKKKREAAEFDRIFNIKKGYERLKKSQPPRSKVDLVNYLDANGIKYVETPPDEPGAYVQGSGRLRGYASTEPEDEDTTPTTPPDLTFGTAERNGQMYIIYTRADQDVTDLTSEVFISKKLYEERYGETAGKVWRPATGRPTLLASVLQVAEEILKLTEVTAEGSAALPERMTAEQAMERLSKPQPSAQRDEPWIGTGDVKNFVHIYVDTEYTLEQEADLFARFGGKTNKTSPPTKKRKDGGADDLLVKEIQYALLVTGTVHEIDVRSYEKTKNHRDPTRNYGEIQFQVYTRYFGSRSVSKIIEYSPNTLGSSDTAVFANEEVFESHRKIGGLTLGPIAASQQIFYVDGKFGKTTEEAVKKFQKDNGLTVDGVVGRNTYLKIIEVHGSRLKAMGMTQISDSLKVEVLTTDKGWDTKYLTKVLARKALQKVFKYYKKDASWRLDLSDPSIKEIYPGLYNPQLTEPVKLSINDDSLFDLENVDSDPFRTIYDESDPPVSFCTVRSQTKSLPGTDIHSEDKDLQAIWWAEQAVPTFFIAPSRPSEFFKVEYVIDRKKLDVVTSAGGEKVLSAVDAGIMAFESAALVYDKVAEFLEDPGAAFELAEEMVSKAVEDYAAAKIEAVSEFKRDAVKNAGKNTRNAWRKLRKKTEKDRRDRLLKERAAKNAEEVQSRDVQLLGGTARFETRTFKKTLDKVANKMVSLSTSYEDMKKESANIQSENRSRAEVRKKEISNPFNSYRDFLNIKPELNLREDSTRLQEIYGALESFLKLNGHNYEDKLGRFLEFNFEKVRNKYGAIIGSRIKSIYFVGPKRTPNEETALGLVESNQQDDDATADFFAGNTPPDSDLSRRHLEIGFEALLKKPPFNNMRIMAYFAQLEKINSDLFKSGWGSRCGDLESLPVMDFISRYVYPAPGTASLVENSANTSQKKTNEGKPIITVKENIEQDIGVMFSQIKSSADRLTEKASITAQNIDSLVTFQKGKVHDANDLLPLGELCTWEEITQKFFNTFDFKSYWCEFSACLPDIPWPLIIDLRFDFPKLPKLPTLKELRILFDRLYISLIEMLIRFFCTLVNKLLDMIRLPNCDEVFEGALYGAASLIEAIKEHDKETPVPIGSYDISSQFLRTQPTPTDAGQMKVQKKMLDSLTSYGIPNDLISDPDSDVNATSMTNMMDDLSNLMRPSELTGLLKGKPTTESLAIIKNYIDISMPDLKDYIGDENSIQDFFANLGGLIDVEVINKIDEIPSILAENRFCPEALDARDRIIMGDLTERQLKSAIENQRLKSQQDAESLRVMLKENPLDTQVKDLYNPGDPSAIISSIPRPMMDIIDSTTRSIFEMPKFAFLTDVAKYTKMLYSDESRPLEYEDPEFVLDLENKALEAIEILTKNQSEIQSALAGSDIKRKWDLRELLYERFYYDAVVVEKRIESFEYGTKRDTGVPRHPGATGFTQVITTAQLYQKVDNDQIREIKRTTPDPCGDLNIHGEEFRVHLFVRRNAGWDPVFFQTPNNKIHVVNRPMQLSLYVGDFLPNGSSLEGQTIDGPNAPILRRDDGTAINMSSDMDGASDQERQSLVTQITDSAVARITELQNAILRHLEVNLSDKNESALLPLIRKYYKRSEEIEREADAEVQELFRVLPTSNDDHFAFELSLPQEFRSSLRYEEHASTGREDLFMVTLDDRVLTRRTERFAGCELLPEKYTRPLGVSSLAKKDIYVASVYEGLRDLAAPYRISRLSNELRANLHRSADSREYGEFGKILYDSTYNKTFEMFFEELMDQISDSRIFRDTKYIESLDARIRGTREYDDNGCLIRETKGLIDFDKIVKSATDRVVGAFEDPSFHPSKMEFNAGSLGPFEVGVLHSAIYLMINIMVIEFILRGGVAFSTFSANALMKSGANEDSDDFLKKYLVHFILSSLNYVLIHPKAAVDGIELLGMTQFHHMPFRKTFVKHCVDYVQIVSPDTFVNLSSEQKSRAAIHYLVDDVIRDGKLTDMVESLFQGSEEESKPFIKTFLENLETHSIPSFIPEVQINIPNPAIHRDENFSWPVSAEVPDEAVRKGRFQVQKYLRVIGEAASSDLSRYTFSPEFIQKKEEILNELRQVERQPFMEDDPSAIADRISERIDVLETVEPLPGADDDEFTNNGQQTEVVTFDELNSFLRKSYQGSFNKELCDLMGLIYKHDPEHVCFMMPKIFTKFPGKLIKRRYASYRIDRGFEVPSSGEIRGLKLYDRYKDWHPATNWRTYDAIEEKREELDEEAFNDWITNPQKSQIDSLNIRYSSRNYFNDVFDGSLITSNTTREADVFKEGIFAKCGREGKMGIVKPIPGDRLEVTYHVLSEDACALSNDFGQDGIDKIFSGYSLGGLVEDKRSVVVESEMRRFSESFTPKEGSRLYGHHDPNIQRDGVVYLKEEVTGSVSAMNASFQDFQIRGTDGFDQGMENHHARVHEGEDYLIGSRHPHAHKLDPDYSEDRDAAEQSVLPWKMGEITREEFEQIRGLGDIAPGISPDTNDDEVLLGPNDVYEEWTHYLIKDPGYVFNVPGESLHQPESMGVMMDLQQYSRSPFGEDAIQNDRSMWQYQNQWVCRMFHEGCKAIVENSNEDVALRRVGQKWGWGSSRFSNGLDGSDTDRFNKGHGRYDHIFRWNQNKMYSRDDNKHRTEIKDFPRHAPILSRPLGFQNEAYEHEDTNELGANEYACPVDILLTRIDYKVKGEAVHTEWYAGSRFNDSNVMRGDLMRNIDSQVELRTVLLSEAVNRLTAEWVENTTAACNLSQGEIDTEWTDEILRGKINKYKESFASDSLGLPADPLSDGDVQTIFHAILKIGLLSTSLIDNLGNATLTSSVRTLVKGDDSSKLMRNIPQPFRLPIMQSTADVLKNGYTYVDVDPLFEALLPPGNFLSAEAIMNTLMSEGGEIRTFLQKSMISENVVDGQKEDFALRPLSRSYDWTRHELIAPFDKSRYKTNMLTTSKVYSAAALMAGNCPRVQHIEPPFLIFGNNYVPRTTETFGTAVKVTNIEQTRDKMRQINEIFNDSMLVDTSQNASWDSPTEMFSLASNREELTQQLASICNQYTEGVLNRRTYHGFWGYSSSPRYLEGQPFANMLNKVAFETPGIRYGAGGQDSQSETVWSEFFRIHETFPSICDSLGGNEQAKGNGKNMENEYALERLPYAYGSEQQWNGEDLPAVYKPPEHFLVGDGLKGDREEDIASYVQFRGDLDTGLAEVAIQPNTAPATFTGFRSFLVNKGINLIFKVDSSERQFWNEVGDQLATPMDEPDTMANYGGTPSNPRGIFERLNQVLKTEMSKRLESIIQGSNYKVGVRLIHIQPEDSSTALEEVYQELDPRDPFRLGLSLLKLEERLMKVEVQDQSSGPKSSWALPIAFVEESMDRCTLNWRNVKATANSMVPDLLQKLSEDETVIEFLEKAFPLQRLSLLSGLYSVMTLSTKDGFDKFMMPSKTSIANIFTAILSKKDFENVPSGAELWLRANGYMTSTGPRPSLSDELGNQLDDFFTQLITNALNTPIIMLRNLAGGLDPAYKSMMKQQSPDAGKIKNMTWSSIKTTGVDGKMKNGLSCDANYVPVNIGFPLDLVGNALPYPNSDFFKALRKFGQFIRRKRKGGTSDSYGDFLGPFGMLALSLPELDGETPSAVAKRQREAQFIGQEVEDCAPAEVIENNENNTEEDN